MKLKPYRRKHELSQQDMAHQLRCTQGWFSRLELGLVKPSAELAVRIEKITNGEVPRWEYRRDLWEKPGRQQLK